MRVDISHAGIAELARDPRLADQMLIVAEDCKVTAAAKAHVVTGTYRRSMFAAKLRRGNGAFFGSNDTKAMLMEYGSKHNRAFHVLRDSARANHLRLVITERATR